MSIETLKEEARRYEQREAWQSALDLYLKAIAKLEEGDNPDISLYNRVGDLFTRLNRLDDAIGHYESAIDLYMDAELPNNAIAVCKKILRNAPNRASAFLRMGQIRARQGFIPDARQNFLTYAELKMRVGDADEAFRALVEFADLAPGDVGIRIAVADQMESQGRLDDAVGQLLLAHRALVEQGRSEEADATGERIRLLEPDADLSVEVPEVHDPEAEGSSGESGGGAWGLAGFETTALAGFDESQRQPVEAEDSQAPAEELEQTEPDDWAPLEGESAPTAGVVEEPEEEEPEEDFTPLPTLDVGEELDPLPPPIEVVVDDQDPGDLIRATEEGLVEEPGALLMSGQDLLAEGRVDEAMLALERAHRAFADEDDLGQAMRVVREMILQDPDQALHHQRLVEYAFRSNDRTLLIPAYLELADCLSRTGDSEGAVAVFGQVIQIDPENRRALEGIGRERPEEQMGEPPVAASTDYVDLGSLILGEDQEKTTRWTVMADAPSGDEDADFKKMLAQFKEKVAENLDLQDVNARYDLGTAYKEMGLLDEAIAEFQAALRADAMHLPTYELLGQCFLDAGKSEVAIRALGRALDIPYDIEDEMLGIYYYLGRAHENVGNSSEAVDFYEKVFALDINFMDVTERLRALR